MSQENFCWKQYNSHTDPAVYDDLDRICGRLKANDPLDAFVVICHDTILYDWYNTGYDFYTSHWIASVAKSVVGGISFLVALQDGLMHLEDPVVKYIPEWKSHVYKANITLRHLITHTSGMEDALPKQGAEAWRTRFWEFPHHYTVAKNEAPVRYAPGKIKAYSNPGFAILGYCIARVFHLYYLTDLRSVLRERIMQPLGIQDCEWILDWDEKTDPEYGDPEAWGGAGRPAEIDGMRIYAIWGGANFSPNALARIARLVLQKGVWEGKRILDEKLIDLSLKAHESSPAAKEKEHDSFVNWGLGWRLNRYGKIKNIPRNAFYGAGRGLQVLFVVPSLGLTVIRLGRRESPRSFFDEMREDIFLPICRAIEN